MISNRWSDTPEPYVRKWTWLLSFLSTSKQSCSSSVCRSYSGRARSYQCTVFPRLGDDTAQHRWDGEGKICGNRSVSVDQKTIWSDAQSQASRCGIREHHQEANEVKGTPAGDCGSGARELSCRGAVLITATMDVGGKTHWRVRSWFACLSYKLQLVAYISLVDNLQYNKVYCWSFFNSAGVRFNRGAQDFNRTIWFQNVKVVNRKMFFLSR